MVTIDSAIGVIAIALSLSGTYIFSFSIIISFPCFYLVSFVIIYFLSLMFYIFSFSNFHPFWFSLVWFRLYENPVESQFWLPCFLQMRRPSPWVWCRCAQWQMKSPPRWLMMTISNTCKGDGNRFMNQSGPRLVNFDPNPASFKTR